MKLVTTDRQEVLLNGNWTGEVTGIDVEVELHN